MIMMVAKILAHFGTGTFGFLSSGDFFLLSSGGVPAPPAASAATN